MANPIFTGAGVAIVTPFNDDLSVNYEKFGEFIDFQIDNGTDAIIVCGTTGECSTLSEEEHMECIRFTVERANKRVPVIAGTGSNDTATAIMLSKEAEKVGADGLLLVTPYYNKSSQKGLIAHFYAIADAVNIPVIIYNIPGRTGVSLTIDTFKELSKHKNIVAVKEASGDISFVARLCAETDLDVYSGNDDQIVPLMALGGKGVISVLSNCMPKETHDMTQACLDGDFEKARDLQLKYLEFTNALFCEVNPIPVKEALNYMGWNVGGYRLPLTSMGESNSLYLKSTMEKIGLI